MRRIQKRIIVTLLLLGTMTGIEAAPQDWIYTVREREHLWNICARYVKEPLCWIKLGKYNELRRPNVIKPGTAIRIPYAWLKTLPKPAQIVYRRGELSYIPAVELAKLPWKKTTDIPSLEELQKKGITPKPLPEDGKIYMGDRVISGDGNARVEFADGSQMMIRPGSDIIFDRISVKGKSKFVDTLLILKQGSTVNSVTPKPDKRSRFSIDTPAGVAAVRGTEFRVNVEQAEAAVMRSEVLKGLVAVSGSADKSEQEVKEGYGIRTEQGKPAPAPRKLLPALTWTDSSGARETQPLELAWQEIPGAEYYQLDLFDAQGLIATSRTESSGFTLSGLADGEYRVVGRAVDDIGLKGMDVERNITLYTPPPVPQLSQNSLDVAPSGTEATVSWPAIDTATGYRIQISSDPEFRELIVDERITAPSYTHKSHRLVHIRASALYGGEIGESEMSAVIHWQPEPDYTKVIVGVFSVILAIVIF